MIWLVVAAAGFVVGVVVGRWWALVAPAALAAYVYAVNIVELPDWLMALLYGGSAAAGVAAGVLVRTRSRTR